MKKLLAIALALVMVLSLVPAAFADKAPEEYSGTLTIYSPHDSDPLNDGVAAFEAAYPNVKVEVVADGTSNLVANLVTEIEVLRGSYETLQKEYTRACDGAKQEVSSMADFLILQAEKWSATDLREKAIKMVGIKEYLRRRIEFGFGLWEDDKKALSEILTAE